MFPIPIKQNSHPGCNHHPPDREKILIHSQAAFCQKSTPSLEKEGLTRSHICFTCYSSMSNPHLLFPIRQKVSFKNTLYIFRTKFEILKNTDTQQNYGILIIEHLTSLERNGLNITLYHNDNLILGLYGVRKNAPGKKPSEKLFY